MPSKILVHKGHLIDSGMLSTILNLILQEGADYTILHFDVGKVPEDETFLRLEVQAAQKELLESVASKLSLLGVQAEGEIEAEWQPAEKDKSAPEGFYSTTNHRTEVFVGGNWKKTEAQRMDAAIVLEKGRPVCRKLRDIKTGDQVLVGTGSVRVYPPEKQLVREEFAFMNNDVSSERNASRAAEKIALQMRELKENNQKIIVVAGPVVVHTGGADALAALIRDGWVSGLLGGNAIAVHDLEYRLFGTSLGVDLSTGRPTHEGHKNHMMAINTVYTYGSIRKMIEEKALGSGLMYELEKTGTPYCLAGSIRDDGPLPETETDMINAQAAYAEIISGAGMLLMLSTMLHSIGTGNMAPSWIPTVCVDINPAVVTKLTDRGSAQTVGVVSDVGLFLRELAGNLNAAY